MQAAVSGGLGHVQPDRVGDRLAGVDGLDETELAGVGLDEVGPADEDLLPIAGAQPRPATVVGRSARGGDGGVDVGRATLGDLGDRPARGRVLGREAATAGGVAEVAVDEETGPEVEALGFGPGFVDRGNEGVGHAGLRQVSGATPGARPRGQGRIAG